VVSGQVKGKGERRGMESLFFLIPLSLVIVGLAVAVFVWAVNSGQYDDVDREGERILYDDDLATPEKTESKNDQQEGNSDD
jgi:cbb3-type cytochrome oxidase maturation protein